MTAQTPWHSYRTARPARFLVGIDGHADAYTAIGSLSNNGALSTGTVQGLFVSIKTRPGRGGFTQVPTYTIRLPRWTENVMPEVCLHPLALPHLFVSEQIARGDVMGLLGASDAVATTQSTLIDRSREDVSMLRDYLGEMLGRRRFRVTLQTDFDLSVRRARA